ncbi:MAG: mannitol-1-phosphate 5-dehydrogenase, partial [Planctomycetota bacterium]|nr:mannitol-1-phosphate 5-dehydrogenase [Planctomycetota bacterium]
MPQPEPAAPVAVQIGAGKIGRGLMGELFFASGYRTVFVDIDRPLVKALQGASSYEVHHVTNASDKPVHVAGFSALDAADIEAVAEAIAGAALVCTAVGARNLPDVAPSIARGLAVRIRRGAAAPLNIIACENLV